MTEGSVNTDALVAEKKHADEKEQVGEELEEEEEDEADIALTVTPAALQNYTMRTLRQYAKKKKMPAGSARKQDLIAAILAYNKAVSPQQDQPLHEEATTPVRS